jgi:hypothetical protein
MQTSSLETAILPHAWTRLEDWSMEYKVSSIAHEEGSSSGFWSNGCKDVHHVCLICSTLATWGVSPKCLISLMKQRQNFTFGDVTCYGCWTRNSFLFNSLQGDHKVTPKSHTPPQRVHEFFFFIFILFYFILLLF